MHSYPARRRLFVFCLLFALLTGSGIYAQPHRLWGLHAGASVSLGSPQCRVGLSAAACYAWDFVQLGVSGRTYYVRRGLGPRPYLPGWESQLSAGALLGFGPPRESEPAPVGPLSNYTYRQYAVAYCINLYKDQIKTSQRTGSVAVHSGRFRAVMENDVLSGGLDDRFRTGGFLFGWQQAQWDYAVKIVLWTGDTRSEGVTRVRKSDYPGRYGYKDLSSATYGHFSHGILSLQAAYRLPYGQWVQGNAGIDSEWVRHIFQNWLIHDMWFVPPSWVKAKNAHVPMLDREGLPYLFRPGQQVKKARLAGELSVNPGVFY